MTTTSTTPTTTSTTTTTTTTTTAHLAVVTLQVTIQEVFVPALSNPQSTEFQTLAVSFTSVCDVIYQAKYGILFIRTIVISFIPVFHSRMAADTQVELEVVFNDTAIATIANATMPKDIDVKDTLKEAVTNPNSTFNLSVVPNSITIIRTPIITTNFTTNTVAPPIIITDMNTMTAPTTTTAVTAMTTPTTTSAPSTTTVAATITLTTVPVEFTSRETFTSDLSNSSSQAFQTRASLIKTQLEPFYQSAFTSFNSLTVTEFRNGSIINTMNLAFRSSVLNSTKIRTILINSAQKITVFNIDTTTIKVNGTGGHTSAVPTTTTEAGTTITKPTGKPATVPVTGPATTTTFVAPTTTVSSTASTLTMKTTKTTTTLTPSTTTTTTPITTKTTAHPVVFTLKLTIEVVYVPALTNTESTEFQTLALTITSECDEIYQSKYGIIFIQTIVIAFLPVSRRSLMPAEIQVEMEVVFQQISAESRMSNDIENTLKEAVTNPNSNFNFSVYPDSITVIRVPNTSTGATTITMASPVITTVVPAAATTTTAAATTTSVATNTLTTVSVEFTSKGETFISDLSTSSSQAFQTRASLIKTQLEPFYRSAFTSFNSLTVIKFRNGSIINTMNLAFSSSAVPNSKEIGTVLIKAAQNITAFNINPTSVTVSGEVVTSSGISSKTSLFTASCLVVLSLLLSS
ncbi:mucin-5AC-like [Oncorhynchus masou masou]|uniref:mucin-5AC-like n=1 Tax=Oncorhynchus masou masou TaxID=90313 RepID=UPI0031839FE5